MDRDRILTDPGLPLKYLESYPYPAFVLLLPIPQRESPHCSSPAQEQLPFTRAAGLGSKTFDILWSNRKWDALVGETPLLECFDIAGAREFGDWLSGARMQRALGDNRGSSRRTGPTTFGHLRESGSHPRSLSTIDTDHARSSPNPNHGSNKGSIDGVPEGFWEAGSQYEDRSSVEHEGWSRSTDGAGVEGLEGVHPGHATLLIQLVNPRRIALEMTKTTFSAPHLSKANHFVQSETHSIAIITTTPRSAFLPDAGSSPSTPSAAWQPHLSRPALHSDLTVRPFMKNEGSELADQGSDTRYEFTQEPDTAKASAFDLKSIIPHPSRPLLFNRDGTVSRANQLLPGSSSAKDPTDVHHLFETTDWSKTPLGPRDTWPQSLKTMVSVMFAYPSPACIWWGKDFTLIYNKANSQTIEKHPEAFGKSGPIAWAEVWDSLGPLAELVSNGTPVWKEDDLLLLANGQANGNKVYECYHTWMWVPIVQEDGTVGGLWNATMETTQRVLVERRLATIRDLGEMTLISRSIGEFDNAVKASLEVNPHDIPFFTLCHVTPEKARRSSTITSGNGPNGSTNDTYTIKRTASVGVPLDHPSTPETLTISLPRVRHHGEASEPGLQSPTLSVLSCSSAPSMSPLSLEDDSDGMPFDGEWPIRKALQTRRLVLVSDCRRLVKDYPIRVWDELPSAAVVIPITSDSDGEIPSAVLILGLNPRRPFDEDYENFVQLLRVQLASGLASVRANEVGRQKMDELAALDRAKNLLFSNISHEFKTPLTLISGPLEDVVAVTRDSHQKELLQLAQSNVRRLNRLVSTLMDVSRLEAGKLAAQYRPVNLGRVTKDLADLFVKSMKKVKLEYTVDCDLTLRETFVDSEQWEKIVLNLLSNAIKYTLKGSVKVSLLYHNEEAILQISDTGVGIPSSDLHRIGERFHRVASVSRSHEGTGIGLSLVKELTRLHRGTFETTSVTAEESLDGSHGSTFRVKIPLGSHHLPHDAIYHDALKRGQISNRYGNDMLHEVNLWDFNRNGSSAATSSESGSIGPSSVAASRGFDPERLYFENDDIILLVDDSYETRKYMRTVFSPYCQVVEARDGEEALKLCAENRPDLIITDVMMPILDGFGLLEALKASKELNDIPVIICTARGGDESKIEGLMAGADDYLVKPFNAKELIARSHIQLLLGRNRQQLQSAYENQTQELQVVLEYSPVGLFRAMEDQTIPFVNATWYDISGYPRDEPISNWGVCVAESSREAVMAFWESLYDDHPEETRSLDFQFKNGKWVTLKMVRLDLVSAGLEGLLGCVTDITERRQHEEAQRVRLVEAEERRIQAEEAKQQQELLIDITSHEIRNPISSVMQISTNLMTLQEQLGKALEHQTQFQPTRQLLNNIEEDIEALESIYQCGLSQERIYMLELFDVEVNIQKEVQKVTSMFQSEARMNRIALSYKMGESMEKLGIENVKTDPVRLGQVMTNLVSNGIRFTSSSSVRRIELKFDLSLDPPDDENCLPPPVVGRPTSLEEDQPIYMYMEVTDTGPGLTEDELEMLFHRFSQVSPKTHTVFGGSGLGLFVCRRITNLMGGRIEVVSDYGHGSTFRFFIEARTCRSEPQSVQPAENGSAVSRPRTLKNRDTAEIIKTARSKVPNTDRKLHILIVEDNLINQTVLARQLTHVGFTCEVASNGLQALDKIRKVSIADGSAEGQRFDCVLMDLEMPIMDGLTALRHLRVEEAEGKLYRNAVIALTGNARQGQIDEAKASGMDEVVIKPYRLDNLLNKIEDVMRLNAL